MSSNRAMVIGNLGGDPELRHLPSGQPVVSFSIATDEAYTDKHGQKQEHVEWHRVVAFGKLAETCGEYLKKGRQVVCKALSEMGKAPRIRLAEADSKPPQAARAKSPGGERCGKRRRNTPSGGSQGDERE